MTDTTSAVPVPSEDQLAKAHAEATAAIARTGDEVTRLNNLLRDTAVAIARAEQRAADAVSAPDAAAGSDEQCMQAVATAKARRDAVATALQRAKKAEADAKAALPEIERQLERVKAVRTLSDSLPPVLAEIDQAIAMLGRAMPIAEKLYHTGMYDLLGSFRFPDGLMGPQPLNLMLDERIRSELFKYMGRAAFVNVGPINNFKAKSISAGVMGVVENYRAQLLEREAHQQATASAKAQAAA